jgi:serine protease
MTGMQKLMRASFGPGLVAASLVVALTARAGGAAAADGTAEPASAEVGLSAATFGKSDESPERGEVLGEIAVDIRDGVSQIDIAELAAHFGLSLRPNSSWSPAHDNLEVAEVDPLGEAAILAELEKDPRVEHAERMALLRATFVPDDPLYADKQWHLRRVGAERAWNYTCGRGVTVAVIDTGVACFDKGPFSRGSDLVGTRCRGGWNFVADSAEAYDDHGHGTHVAGTIAQTTNNGIGTAGLAYCATLMPVKVLNKQGFGTVTNVAEGIRLAADDGAQVINLSLGGPIRSRILEDAVNHALSKGVVVVAAAGNSGQKVGWPAAYAGVLAVSATDDGDRIAWFSSRGSEISIAAPGVSVTQQTVCNGGRDKCEIFRTFNGTSMASPHVAGVAAMIEALGVTRASAVRDVLAASARPMQDKDLFGSGIVDGGAAVWRVFWGHFVLRVAALAGLAWWLFKKGRPRRPLQAQRIAVVLAGALMASTGLFPLAPLFGLEREGWVGTITELAMRPLGEWDLLVGAGLHRWLLLASALPVLALTAVGFGSRLRAFIGGVALGTTALLVQMTWSSDTAFVAGPWLALLWMAANALVTLWIARVALVHAH